MLTLMLALSCAEGDPEVVDTGVARSAVPRPERVGVIWEAPVTRAVKSMPAWGLADLPDRLEALTEDPGGWPAHGDYAQRVCAGLDTTRSQWRLRLLSADAESPWSGLAMACATPSLCEWLQDHANHAEASLSGGFMVAVEHCESARVPEPPAFVEEHGLTMVSWPFRSVDGGVDHEGSLGRLAVAVGLRRVVFRARASKADVPHHRRRVALFAWFDGIRLRTLSYPEVERSLLTSHVGIVNAVLAAKEAPRRLGVAMVDEFPVIVVGDLEWWEEQAADSGIEWMYPVAYAGWDANSVPLPQDYDTGFPLIGEAPN